MAKKVVATLKTGTGKDWAKIVKVVKSPKQVRILSVRKWYQLN